MLYADVFLVLYIFPLQSSTIARAPNQNWQIEGCLQEMTSLLWRYRSLLYVPIRTLLSVFKVIDLTLFLLAGKSR